MRYASLKKNDVANAPGIAVSFYTQGCPHRCPGCFNPGTWDFEGGLEFTEETMQEILSALTANGIQRSLCILGGEPMCKENVPLTHLVITRVLAAAPNTKIYIWSGYLYEDLLSSSDVATYSILQKAHYLIDGPFIEAQKDLTLKMRGSRNQRIINLKTKVIEGGGKNA